MYHPFSSRHYLHWKKKTLCTCITMPTKIQMIRWCILTQFISFPDRVTILNLSPFSFTTKANMIICHSGLIFVFVPSRPPSPQLPTKSGNLALGQSVLCGQLHTSALNLIRSWHKTHLKLTFHWALWLNKSPAVVCGPLFGCQLFLLCSRRLCRFHTCSSVTILYKFKHLVLVGFAHWIPLCFL